MSQYKTLSDYFTRRLRPGVRPISVIGDLVSPADGTITVSSPLKHSGFTHMVKGLQYSLEVFLGSLDNIGAVIWDNENDSGCIYDDGRSEVSETSETPLLSPSLPVQFQLLLNNCDNSTQLYETTIYLSPGDYHRLVPSFIFHFITDCFLVQIPLPGRLDCADEETLPRHNVLCFSKCCQNVPKSDCH